MHFISGQAGPPLISQPGSCMGRCVHSYISSNFQTHELKCVPGRKLTSQLCFKFNLQITQERIGPHENTMSLSF